MEAYLGLLESCLCGILSRDPSHNGEYDESKRLAGGDWPKTALTMIGVERLRHLRGCCASVINRALPGAFLECGVWRGGAAMMMKAVADAMGSTREIICADSFCGLPVPSLPQDQQFTMQPEDLAFLAVPLEEVKDNFRRYGLLDASVKFLPGWFRDTLQGWNKPLAILRIDGDLYESTMDALTSCYPHLVSGGFCIIDDYGSMLECRRAVHDFQWQFGCHEAIMPIDHDAVYWMKE